MALTIVEVTGLSFFASVGGGGAPTSSHRALSETMTRFAVRCACKMRNDCSFHLLAARNADLYHALLAGVGLQQRPSAMAASLVSPAFASTLVPAARAIASAAPLPLLPGADGCRVSIRHRSQALGPRLPSPKNKSGRNTEFHFRRT